MPPIILAWSSGKDSAFTLHHLRSDNQYQVIALLTTLTADYDRISMHGVRISLVEQQAKSLGLPLEIVTITKNAPNEEYEARMAAALTRYQQKGVNAVAFGDIFLEDVRQYRLDNLAKLGMQGVFPLWLKDSHELVRAFIDLGFKAVTTCIDTQVLDARFAGRLIDESFLAELPEGIDPCGENGEFHSFVFDGPVFKEPVPFTFGERVLRDERFAYIDLLPG
ncbi:MAG: diphthine--ammonia ligase [Chloroflexi bacterium]|nr:diphthine--ammonia ligase [Chloroflexota bacterium]